jgi:hypothetical protein
MTQPLDEALSELVLANHILANESVLDGFGHVSIRAPDDPSTYFVSRARAPELVERDDLIRFTLDSEPVGSPKGRFLFGAGHPWGNLQGPPGRHGYLP